MTVKKKMLREELLALDSSKMFSGTLPLGKIQIIYFYLGIFLQKREFLPVSGSKKIAKL